VLKYIHEEKVNISLADLTSLNVMDFETSKLAEQIGMPPNVVTDWKNGRLKSYTKYAAQIADYYNVSLDWLSGKTDIKKDAVSNDTDDIRLSRFKFIISQLSDESLEEVLRYAHYLGKEHKK
jgi:transcriptional regulator with XRE-family HTH domain